MVLNEKVDEQVLEEARNAELRGSQPPSDALPDAQPPEIF
jgi:hypothetical protein